MRPVDQNWLAADLETVDTCPVCGEPGRSLLFDGLTDDIFEAAPGMWTLYRCSHCASGYLDPRPDPSSIGRAYEDYYTHTSIEHAVVRRRGLLGSWLHDLINGYQNRRYGFQRLPSRPLGRWLIPLMPPLRAAADSEARQLPGMANERRLLDVGCGNGDFMNLASRSGWKVEGLDFDDKAVELVRSRGMVAHLGGIESLADRDAFYDMITLSHVIEHAHSPLELLRHAYGMLRPGGILWLETPNLDSLGAHRFGRHWRGLEPPRHLVLFNRSSLLALLAKAGFKAPRQHWRGLAVFDVFAASQAAASSHSVRSASYAGRPPAYAIWCELREMLQASRREFLTFTAHK